MKLVSYDAGDGTRAGVLEDDRVVDAWAALGEPHRGSLRELIAAGRVDDLRATFGNTGTPAHPRSAVSILPPIPDPDKIICIGLNYMNHAAEGGFEPPTSPTIFGKYRNALAPAGATVLLPRNSRKVDYEAEVAFVVGRRAKEVEEAEALDHIAGYTLLNDLSARNLQFATPQWMSGKVFDGSAPCGPALVTPDEAGSPRCDRDLTDAERRADAGGLDREPDLQRPAAALPPLRLDDPRAGGHRLDRHAGGRRQPPRSQGLARQGRSARDRVPHPGPARDQDLRLASLPTGRFVVP